VSSGVSKETAPDAKSCYKLCEQESVSSDASRKPIAEVIQSSTQRVVAQCTQRKDRPPIALPPPFGSLVLIEGEPETVGVVCSITTSGYDPARRPTALELPLNKLYEEYPELPELLVTEIEAIPIACAAEAGFIQGTPPTPPPLHAGVHPFPASRLGALVDDLHFLRLIYDASTATGEELLVQTLRQMFLQAPSLQTRQEWLLRVGKELARVSKEDYDRLRYILERLER